MKNLIPYTINISMAWRKKAKVLTSKKNRSKEPTYTINTLSGKIY